MGRHSAPVRSPHSRHSRRRPGVPVALSAAVLAGFSLGAAPASAADDVTDTEDSTETTATDSSAGTSAGLLDPVGDVVGGAIGTGSGTSDAADGVSTLGGDGVGGVVDGLVDGTADAALTGTGLVDPDSSTEVSLDEKNDSGASGSAEVTVDDVTATATGLDPDERYVSFFYGATSSADNANPCIIDGTNPLPSDQTIGEWDVDEDGNGTLTADNPLGARYGLQAGTMSIRKVEHSFSSATALPVNPASYSLVSCGEVERIDALDPVTDQLPALPKLPSVAPIS